MKTQKPFSVGDLVVFNKSTDAAVFRIVFRAGFTIGVVDALAPGAVQRSDISLVFPASIAQVDDVGPVRVPDERIPAYHIEVRSEANGWQVVEVQRREDVAREGFREWIAKTGGLRRVQLQRAEPDLNGAWKILAQYSPELE
jgi:hypothetical protein